jgi:hypothetical protein
MLRVDTINAALSRHTGKLHANRLDVNRVTVASESFPKLKQTPSQAINILGMHKINFIFQNIMKTIDLLS